MNAFIEIPCWEKISITFGNLLIYTFDYADCGLLDSTNRYLSQILEIKAELDIKRSELDKMPNSFDLVRFNEELEKFEEGIQRFNERMKNSDFAAKWLDFNRGNLVSSVSSFTFGESSDLESFNREVQEFEWDIDDYIDWLRHSLKLGKPIPLDEINISPSSNHERYVAAFRFIKTEKVVHQLPDQVAEEVEAYLDYLIEYFSS